jgi:hypothetical protein
MVNGFFALQRDLNSFGCRVSTFAFPILEQLGVFWTAAFQFFKCSSTHWRSLNSGFAPKGFSVIFATPKSIDNWELTIFNLQ